MVRLFRSTPISLHHVWSDVNTPYPCLPRASSAQRYIPPFLHSPNDLSSLLNSSSRADFFSDIVVRSPAMHLPGSSINHKSRQMHCRATTCCIPASALPGYRLSLPQRPLQPPKQFLSRRFLLRYSLVHLRRLLIVEIHFRTVQLLLKRGDLRLQKLNFIHQLIR